MLHLTVEALGLLHKNICKLEDELKAWWENTKQAEDEIMKLPDLKHKVEDVEGILIQRVSGLGDLKCQTTSLTFWLVMPTVYPTA